MMNDHESFSVRLPPVGSDQFLPSLESLLKEEVASFSPEAATTLVLLTDVHQPLVEDHCLGAFCTENTLLVIATRDGKVSRQHAIQFADTHHIPCGRLFLLGFPRRVLEQWDDELLVTLRVFARVALPDVVITDPEDDDHDHCHLNALTNRAFAENGVSILSWEVPTESMTCLVSET